MGDVAAIAVELYRQMFGHPYSVMMEYGLPQLQGHACVTSTTRPGEILRDCWTSPESSKQNKIAEWREFQELAAAHPEVMDDPETKGIIEEGIFHKTRYWVAESEPWLSLVDDTPNLRAGLERYKYAVDGLLNRVGLTSDNREIIAQLIPVFEKLVPSRCCVMLALLWHYALPESRVTFSYACLKRRGSEMPRVIDFATNEDVLSISPSSEDSNEVKFVTVEKFT